MFFRYGSRSLELGQHVLPQLFASGFGSMSVLHWVAGKVFMFAHDWVVQRQPAFHHTASTSQRWEQSVLQNVVDMQSFCMFLTKVLPLHSQLCPVMSLEKKMYLMLDASWMFSDSTGGTSVHLKSRSVSQ